MSAFFSKKSAFFAKNSTLIKTNYASRIWLPDCSKLAVNWKNDNGVTFFTHGVIVKLFWRCFVFLVKLVTSPSFMSMSSLVLELWHIPFIKDWPEIRKSEIPPSEFCPVPGDWGEEEIPNLAQTCLIRCCWILQNARVTAFTVSELFRENQQNGGSLKLPRSVPKLGLSRIFSHGTKSRIFKNFKDVFSGLRHFLAAESFLKMMKNAFYFTSEALFFLKIFNFMSWLFGQVAKRLHKKDKVNSKSYDVTAWLTNSCNTHIALYLKK